MEPYADLEELVSDLLPEIDDEEQIEAIGRILSASSRFIDRYCRRSPGYFLPADEQASERTFRGDGSRYLRLPVFVPNSAELVGFAADRYYETENGWLGLKMDLYSGLEPHVFTRGKLYTVSARWGFEETPAEITQAARLLTLKTWETQRGVLGDITPSGYVVERAMPLLVRETLDLHKKREFEL